MSGYRRQALHRFGDASGDGIVDVSDFNNWNADKWTPDPLTGCGTSPCVSDATYFSELQSHNPLTFTPCGVGDCPTFSVTTVNGFDELHVDIPMDVTIQSFTVTGLPPVPGGIAPDFDNGFHINLGIVSQTKYYDARQQFYAIGATGGLGWQGPVTAALVATYPANSFPASGPAVFFQSLFNTGPAEVDQIRFGTQNVVPEPTTAIGLSLAMGWLLVRIRCKNRRAD